MLTISESKSGTFELPPAGAICGRCSRLIDLGSHESDYQGEKKLQRKLLVSWELGEFRSDGTPHQISRRFGLSLHEKAALRSFLQAWRGRPFSDAELAGFDLTRLLSAPGLLNIGHVERGGKHYANILSISPLPKGMEAPPLTAAPVAFDIDADNAPGILDSLSESLQETICASPEWQARLAASGAAPASAPASGYDDLVDDIPF